jgi:copper transport protein
VGCWALVSPPSAAAHAVLLGSEPSERAIVAASPERIRLFFSEPPDREFFALDVYDASGRRVDRGNPRFSSTDAATLEVELEALETGTYLAVWRALSVDSHVIRGSFPFSVGPGVIPSAVAFELPSIGAPSWAEVAVRWLGYAASLVLVGGFAFEPLVLRPALGGVPSPSRRALDSGLRTGWSRVTWLALAALAIAALLGLVFQAAATAGLGLTEAIDGRALARTLQTRFGLFWGLRVAAVVALTGLVVRARRTSGVRGEDGAMLVGAVLLTYAALGHATSLVAWLVDWVHLLAAGVWIGGLVRLVMIGRGELRPLLGHVVRQFSLVAGMSLAVVGVTGLFNTVVYTGSWQALADTAYGAALSGKLLLIAPLVALAAINLVLTRPRLQRPMPGQAPVRQLRLLVFGEIACAMAVVAVTAILVGQAPAASIPLDGKAFSETTQSDDLAVTFEVVPNQAGDNRLTVQLADAAGRPVANAQPRLVLTMLEMDMGARVVDARPSPGAIGQYQATGGYLSMPGRWQADVEVPRQDRAETTARFPVSVGQPAGASRPAFSPAYILALAVLDPDRRSTDATTVINPRLTLALAIAALAASLLVLRRRVRVSRRASRRVIPGVAGGLFSLTLALGSISVADAYRKSLPNPVPADVASLDRGRTVYAQCVACHGATGRGDGPAGRTLLPRPADFRVHMAAGHTDRQLFDWITHGVDGTAMPAFGELLDEQQRWDAINYIRTFAAPERR